MPAIWMIFCRRVGKNREPPKTRIRRGHIIFKNPKVTGCPLHGKILLRECRECKFYLGESPE